MIISDSWKSYHKLGDHNYYHHMVNHSTNFVDEGNKMIHTKTIERTYKDMKEYVRRPGVRKL